jgi:PadR family transcriptional regulator, regulatory protein PadR
LFHRHFHDQSGEQYPPRQGRRTQGSLQPWLLLLLLQKPSYGYELMDRLSQGKPDTDPGLLYRTLRQLEESGMVHSEWDTEGQGPARRLYKVTPEGTEYLHIHAANIRRLQSQLARFLTEYEDYFRKKKE